MSTMRPIPTDPSRAARVARERAMLEEAEADIAAGRVLSDAAFRAWLRDWEDGKDVPPFRDVGTKPKTP